MDLSFYLAEVQSLSEVEKLKNVQFHKDLMLFSLDNVCGTLTIVMVNIRRVMISLQHPKTSQLLTMIVVNHEGLHHFTTSQASTLGFQ